MNESEMVTAKELSEKFFGNNISVDKLYRLAKNNQIPAKRIVGSWFFPINEIREWIRTTSKVENSADVLKSYGRIKRIKE